MVVICSSISGGQFAAIRQEEKMKNRSESTETVEISFERGRTSRGALTQTKVFPMSQNRKNKKKKIKRLNPVRIEENPGNRGRDYYNLLPGEYCVVTKKIKNRGRGSCITQDLIVGKDDEYRFENLRITPL